MLLSGDFYSQPTIVVARALIGAVLVRIFNGIRLAGIIIETEAYIGENDLGCHAKSGKTARNAVMYGPAGHAYVYFTYGMHWCMNAVTEQEGYPAAVLIRAIQPSEGLDLIASNRNGKDTNGPAKITQALGISGDQNGIDLCTLEAGLWIEEGRGIPDENVIISERVGLFTVPEPWKSMAWRFRSKVR